MKAYLFNAENGLYLGETFAEADNLFHEDGLTSIPPPDYEPGQVPVFDSRQKAWTVKPISAVRELLLGRTVDGTENIS